MAIYNIDGKLGAGKTYFAVNYLLDKYFRYSEILGEYVEKKPVAIVTNIKNFRMDHYSLQQEMSKSREVELHGEKWSGSGLRSVFSKEFIEEIRANNNCRSVCFIIDEAQSAQFFHRKFYDPWVFFFFQYSRHHGVDVFLITQNFNALCKELQDLGEMTIHAVSRSMSLGPRFLYKKFVGDDKVGMVTVKKDQRVFNAYKSFDFEESEKPKSQLTKYVVGIVVGVFVVVVGFKIFVGGFVKNSVSVSSAPVAVAAAPVGFKTSSIPLGATLENKGGVSGPGKVGEVTVGKIPSYEGDKKIVVDTVDKNMKAGDPGEDRGGRSCRSTGEVVFEGRVIKLDSCDGISVVRSGGVISSVRKESPVVRSGPSGSNLFTLDAGSPHSRL